jgi:hypothetical protein
MEITPSHQPALTELITEHDEAKKQGMNTLLVDEEPVLELHLLGEEIGADRRLVLVAELLVDISLN